MTDKPKRPRDANQLAKFIADLATSEDNPSVLRDDSPAEGRSEGGRARAAALTSEQRKEIARVAADARWKKS